MNEHVQADLGAERAALACVIAENACLDEVADVLRADDFYGPRHGVVFGGMLALAAKGEPIDLLTLRAELESSGMLARVGGDEALFALADDVPNTDAVLAYARRIREMATVRAMAAAAARIVATSRKPIEDVNAWLDEAEGALHAVAQSRRTDSRSETMRELIPRVLEGMVERPEAGEVRGWRTGIAPLDKALSGLQAQQLIIVAGRPGMGKSAFAGATAVNVARTSDLHVLVWTGEMARDDWGERMIVSDAVVEGDVVRSGRWSRADWERIEGAARRLMRDAITIDDTPSISLWQLRSKARRIRARHGLALVVVDYLQLMRSGERGLSREQEVAAISRGLKGLAKELMVPVMALSQLNRAAEKSSDKRPSMADLRESGQIEQDSDAILLLYREGYYDEAAAEPSVAEINVAKQRSGRTGTIKAFFDPNTVRWGNLERGNAHSEPFQRAPGGVWDPPDDPGDFSDEGSWR